MKAVVYDAPGPPGVLRYESVPDPEPGPNDALIRVEAISVEGGDVMRRALLPPPYPGHVAGYACAGTVIAVGTDVERVSVGDRVATFGNDGSNAELRAVPERWCWKIPDALDSVTAACIPVAFGTAHDVLFEFGELKSGETVLIHAGASGVGTAAIQLAVRAGARVLTTASSSDKLERLQELGIVGGIDYTAVDYVDEVLKMTDGRGADLIMEAIGGPNLQKTLGCLAYRGRCVSSGLAGRHGFALDVDFGPIRMKNQRLIGCFLGAELTLSDRPIRVIAERMDEVARGQLQVIVAATYPLSAVAEAHAFIDSRAAVGRVVLIP